MEIPHRQLDINMEFREKVRARDITVSCISVQMALGTKERCGLMQRMNGQRGAKKHRSTQPSDINQKRKYQERDCEKVSKEDNQEQSVTNRDHKSWDSRFYTFPFTFILGKITRRSEGQLGKFCNNQGVWSFQFFPPSFYTQEVKPTNSFISPWKQHWYRMNLSQFLKTMEIILYINVIMILNFHSF